MEEEIKIVVLGKIDKDIIVILIFLKLLNFAFKDTLVKFLNH